MKNRKKSFLSSEKKEKGTSFKRSENPNRLTETREIFKKKIHRTGKISYQISEIYIFFGNEGLNFLKRQWISISIFGSMENFIFHCFRFRSTRYISSKRIK